MFKFGRKQTQPALDALDREAIAAHLADWAADRKKPYQAAGFDLEGALKHVYSRESRASGSIGHPWPPELIVRMTQQIAGCSTIPEVNRKIEALQLEHERAIMAPEDDEERDEDEDSHYG